MHCREAVRVSTARAQSLMIDLLLELLQDPRFECRDELHEALLRFEDRSFVSRLIATLRDTPIDSGGHAVRLSVLRLLSALQLPHARQYLLENLSGLGAGGSSASVDKVRELLTDVNEVEEVRRAAIMGLGRSRNSTASPAARFLRDSSPTPIAESVNTPSGPLSATARSSCKRR